MEFNQAPYFDDFDKDKKHLSVLFKAGSHIQARELNVVQSIKQHQIGALGNHLFKNGAKISGCSSSFIQYDYVRVEEVNISHLNHSYKLVGRTSAVEATIVEAHSQDQDDSSLLLVIYTKTGNSDRQVFQPNEVLSVFDGDKLVQTLSVSSNDNIQNIQACGKSMLFVVDEGIFFYNSYFLKLQKQSIIIDRYLQKDQNGNIISDDAYRVGLDIVEDIITADDDKSLLDPHFDSTNFGAPGADRYKVSLYLSIRDYVDDGENTNFIMLAKVRQNHTVEYKKDDTEYGEIMKEFARRTNETYGDFTMNAWKAHFLNEKKNGDDDNKGWSANGSDDKYVAIVAPGEGYVKGYRVATQAETIVRGRKATDVGILQNQKTTVGEPKSIVVTSNTVADWGLIDNDPTKITYKFNMYDPNNVRTGSFYAYDIYKIDTDKYRIYLYNVERTGDIKIENTTSVRMINGSFIGSCPIETFKDALSYESVQLIPTGLKNIISISNVAMRTRTRLSGEVDSSGKITFTAASGTEFAPETHIIAWVNKSGVKTNVAESAITINDSEIEVDLGSSFANATFTMMAISISNNLPHRTKTKRQQTLTINGSTAVSKAGWTRKLKYDVSGIDSITITTNNAPPLDITNEYMLELSNSPDTYNPATLVRKTFRNINPADTVTIKYTYFEHGENGSYFNINSYNIDDLAEVPLYKGLSAADYFDFRPDTLDDYNSYFKAIPVPGTVIQFDGHHYMNRADLLLVNTNGDFYLKEGVPGKVAKLPDVDPDAMALCGIFLDALGPIDKASIVYYDNRRYTVKEVRRLEKRISKAENDVALSMLEMSTLNMSIKDQNGFDRFKNGFMVDNFKSFQASDLANVEYKASLDRNKGVVRPQFKQNNVRLKFDAAKSSNIKVIGNMVIKNYQDDLFVQNPFATQSLSINPYMIFCKKGNLVLSPNIDTWSEDQYKPNITADIDMGVETLREAAELGNFVGNDYGAWVSYNTSIASQNTTSSTASSTARVGNQNVTTNVTTNTTTTTRTTDQSRTVTQSYIGSNMQSYSINDMVKDVSIIPYIRRNTVQFYASNLKPNTRVYAFFDGVDVNIHCRMITQIDSSTGDVLVNRNASMFGTSTLIADGDGNLIGEFRIPANTFFTGEKQFVLTNDPGNTGNPDIETTRCESVYFAGGVSQTKQNATMNVITPTYGTRTTTETRQISSTSTSVSRDVSVTAVNIPAPVVVPAPAATSSRPPMPPPKPGYSSAWHWVWQGGQWVWDPVAQGFSVDQPCFISKVEVYFETVDDKADIIWFEIREMFNGYPTNSAIARKEIKGADLKKYESKDASKAYSVVWDVPVYVDNTKSYAFVVGGFSPETRVFISKLGSKLLNSSKILEEPPLGYTMFRSLNGDTWNAEQYDTMKINIYRCVFDTGPSEVVLYSENDKAFEAQCDVNPIEVQKGSNRVRVFSKDHNLRVNDRVVINFSKDMYYQVTVTNNGIPQIGQPISTPSGSGYIRDVQSTTSLNVYNISIDNMIGVFKKGEEFVCEARKYEYRDLFLVSEFGAAGSPIIQSVVLGTVKSVAASIPTDISGASIALFSKEHIVRDVDTIDSFIIEVESPFTAAGRFGGSNVNLYGHNIKYDVFNVSGQYLPYDCKENWTITPRSFNDVESGPVKFIPHHDIELDNPAVIFSNRNENRIMGKGNSSFKISAKFETPSPYISPVLNTDSFSVTTISNRIELIDTVKYNSAPNGGSRFKPETTAFSGTESFKHITTKVLLENAATDMKIMVDVHTPHQTDFDIYVKLTRIGETADEANLPWMLIDKYTKKNTSLSKDDYISFDLLLSTHCSGWTSTLEYTTYRVKLVGRSPNSCTPVIFKNLRAIAVT